MNDEVKVQKYEAVKKHNKHMKQNDNQLQEENVKKNKKDVE